MSSNPAKDLGKQGESIASAYLEQNGYKILAANFENKLGYRRGEIDIVALDPETEEIVFVEVKARKKDRYSVMPEQAITRQKYRKLSKIISNYLNCSRLDGREYRLDAISVELDTDERKANLKHLKHIYY